MGATESLLPLDTWRVIVDANPVLGGMEPDVEALSIVRGERVNTGWCRSTSATGSPD